MSFAGRVEALLTVPSSTSVSVTNSGGGPTTSTLPADDYFLTAAGTTSGLLSAFQTQLGTDQAPSFGAWSVTIDTSAGGTGLVTIDCTSGAKLVKTGATTAWDASAESDQTFPNDGFIETTVSTTSAVYRTLSLQSTSTARGGDLSENTTDYGLGLGISAGTARIIESGSVKMTGITYVVGDVFRIRRTGSAVTYEKNGTTIYTSATASTGDVKVVGSFFDASAPIDAIRLYASTAYTSPLTWGTETNVTDSYTTYDLTWTSTNLRDLLGFTSNFASCATPQTGTKQARGLWLPNSPMTLSESTTKLAPRVTDQRTTIGPTGVSYSLVGNSRYEHVSAKWQYVPKSQVQESAATYANASWEQFLLDTQWGLGSSWFSVSAPVQIYDNAGFLLGGDLNSGAGGDGWTMLGCDKFNAKRTDSRGYDGLWTIEIPRLVSAG